MKLRQRRRRAGAAAAAPGVPEADLAAVRRARVRLRRVRLRLERVFLLRERRGLLPARAVRVGKGAAARAGPRRHRR